MKRRYPLLLLCVVIASLTVLGGHWLARRAGPMSGAPPYVAEDLEPPEVDPYAWLRDWKRPEGPARVGLQVGHWKNEELPAELERLKGSTGATGGGKAEWEVNLAIAELTAETLRAQGIVVDILPATVPPQYWADVFVAIHADGNLNGSVSGYKIASPRRDFSGNAAALVRLLETSYGQTTGLTLDPNVSRNMRGYYAFAWWRYDHAVHPKTASVIVETGFLTSWSDRRIIVDRPELAAAGIAQGIITFLTERELLKQS